ncbi:MAG TPA: DUF3616 domain-containing protein [Kiritimatiellia bacterium]|nr:DUF3616 domain-containing protein [Kiritimatiellia bacterium]HRU71285.1 DUF3616 domain-containing protein [Kiritimatiellia bacterium]
MLVKSLLCLIGSCVALAHAAPITFTHMADASAGEAVGPNLIVVANDEDNLLRVFRLPDGGAPVMEWDLAPHMALEKKSPEMDIEGSARIADTVYWITSHAPNKTGKARPNRRRFFATRVRMKQGMPHFEPVGRPVTTLLDELSRDPRYAAFGLDAAALKPPKTPGSLNIEALCETQGGGLLIGFRSPLPGGSALLAPLDNPAETVNGQPPHFGAPVLLDLGGNGIRAMIRTANGFLILSGSPLSGGEARLYEWDGRSDTPPVLLPVRFPADTTPEGLTAIRRDGAADVLVLSDDGTRPVDGQPAKTHPDPARRTFRGFLLSTLTHKENP